MNWLRTAIWIIALFPATVWAHEYWIEPERFRIEAGETIRGDLRNGQDFAGSRFSYITSGFDFFTITGPKGSEPVTGRDGDMPALIAEPDASGLHTIAYQGRFDRVTFTDRKKLQQYFDYEGLDDVMARHLARGLSPDRFQERFARSAKALVQVGEPGENERLDALTGLKFELVAEKNPYLLTDADNLPVRLYWEGEPAGDVQIRWFRYRTQSVTGTVRTDADGRAMIPLAGGGKFLLNAVHLVEGDDDPETDTPEWYSHWASLTFGIRGTDAALAAH